MLKFSIRPQIHKTTFYFIVPFLCFQFAYLYLNPFGQDEGKVMAISFMVIVILVLKALMSLFLPFFQEVNVDGYFINQLTEWGGDVTIDIRELDLALSSNTASHIELVTIQGQRLEFFSATFRASDLQKLAQHIDEMLKNSD
ncbi:MAG: hypothetical protein ACPGR2_17710 [Psychrobium sp.]